MRAWQGEAAAIYTSFHEHLDNPTRDRHTGRLSLALPHENGKEKQQGKQSRRQQRPRALPQVPFPTKVVEELEEPGEELLQLLDLLRVKEGAMRCGGAAVACVSAVQ